MPCSTKTTFLSRRRRQNSCQYRCQRRTARGPIRDEDALMEGQEAAQPAARGSGAPEDEFPGPRDADVLMEDQEATKTATARGSDVPGLVPQASKAPADEFPGLRDGDVLM